MKSVLWPAFYWVILVKTSTLFSYFLTPLVFASGNAQSYSFSSDFSFDCMLWSFWQACCLAGQNSWQIFLQEAIWILWPTVSVPLVHTVTETECVGFSVCCSNIGHQLCALFFVPLSQVKSSQLYLYSAFNNNNKKSKLGTVSRLDSSQINRKISLMNNNLHRKWCQPFYKCHVCVCRYGVGA